MTDFERNQFDDPALKGAVQRAMSKEVAPPKLRASVCELLGEAGAQTPPGGWRWRMRIGPSQRRLIAAAVLMVLALSLMGYEVEQTFLPTIFAKVQPATPSVVRFPATFAAAMTLTHDNCALLPDHHLVGGDDLAKLKAQLTQMANVPVFAAALGDGWSFKGAGLCTVGSAKTAHLVFTRGDSVLSVFSMQSPMMCAADASSFEDSLDNHPMAGFRNGDAMYCVVGSSSAAGEMTPQQVAAVMAFVKQTMCPNACCGATPTTAPLQ